MITDDEARSAYGEILKQLRDAGADALVDNILAAVAEVHVRERKRYPRTLEALSARKALALAVRMVAAWLEPSLLVAEARKEFRHPPSAEPEVLWIHDRVDVVAAEPGGREPQHPQGREEVSEIPALTAEAADVLRAHLVLLREITIELEAEEEGPGWRR